MTEETIRKLNIFQGSKEVSVDRKFFKYMRDMFKSDPAKGEGNSF